MPVSLYGQPADYEEINAISERRGLVVIEDAAQSFGAPYKGKKSCGLTKIGATSFFPAKPLGCYGDGGAVFTNDEALHKKMEQIRVHGQASRYNHTMIGINGRLDTLQCAILIEKLKRYDWEIERRNAIASKFNRELSDLGEQCVVPKVRADRGSVWAQYTVLVKDREGFAVKIKEKGVPTSVHYPSPLHHQPVYSHLRAKYSCPVAERVSSECISLPIFPDMTDAQVDQVIAAVRASV
jgi:UDP-2-acetamido-2-deoxy-ribo-hexuluronate aminotransferase